MRIPGLEINLDSDIPVYRQIADGIRDGLADGRLEHGRRLPPTRDLARQLKVNRNTVVAAYELLASDGVVRSYTGRGTFLAAATATRQDRLGASPDDDVWRTAFSRAVEGANVERLLSAYQLATTAEGISFASGFPADDLTPVDEFSQAVAGVLAERGPEVLTYGPLSGSPGLREHIAADMRRHGCEVSADQILITNGSQQAIELVFRTLIDPGDPVVLEDPTFAGALSALGSLGARLVGVPMDDEGIRSDLLALALERHRPRLIYLQPTFQNPTTRVMSAGRRREVLSLAARHGCVIVEDDWAGDLRLDGRDLPTLHAMDSGRRVIYISSFSKKLMPGLRIGWVAAPLGVQQRLISLKQIEDCGTSPLLQEALHRFLLEGGLERHLTKIRTAYRERRDSMLQAIDRHFPEDVRVLKPRGGLFVWVRLPRGIDVNELFLAARHRGVLFSPGELFDVDRTGQNTLRLTFAAVGPEKTASGIETLGRLMKEIRSEGSLEVSDESSVVVMPIV